MAIPYTKSMLIERVVKHLNSGFPNNDWNITDEEVLLYIDSSIPFIMKGQMFNNASVQGVLDNIDAYLVTYKLPVTKRNTPTNEWYVELPQPPLALPTGYDIPNVYFGGNSTGRSQNVLPVSTKRSAYRNNMPKPTGVSYRVEGYNLYLQSNEGQSLLNLDLFVQMPISRTSDINAPMAIPDDAIQPLFEKTVQSILQRYGVPQDIVQDGLPAGNKAS